MTAHRIFALRATTAIAFPDLVELGLEAVLNLPPSEIPKIADRLDRQEFVRKRAKTKRASLHAVLDVPASLPSGAIYKVRVELFFEPIDEERIRLTNRSSITLNGLRLLRLILDIDDWPAGLDGQRNVAGPTSDHGADRVEDLLQTLGDVVEQAVEAIGTVIAPEFHVEEENMWLRKGELTHDLACADPDGVTVALGQSSFRRAIGSTADVYRHSFSLSDGVPVVKWKLTKAGVYLKVYGKTGGLLRHEVSCLNRDSVVDLVGRERDDIGGHEAVNLVRSYIGEATPLLIDLMQHVEEARSALVSPDRLVIELAPLVTVILADDRWTAAAAAAWNSLVLTGVYDAKGERKGTVLRDILEGLTGRDGPLRHGARPTLYHLHPRLTQSTSR